MTSAQQAHIPWDSLTEAQASARGAPLSAEELGLGLKGLGVVALVGLGLLLVSGLFLALNSNYIFNGELTRGVVVDIRSRPSRRGTVYAPVVAYVVAGELYRLSSNGGSSVCPYHIDQEVPVLYMPDNPRDSRIADFTQLYLLPALFGALGLVFCIASGGLAAYVVH